MSGAGTPDDPLVLPGPDITAKRDPASTAQPNVNSVSLPGDGTARAGNRLWMRKWLLTVGQNAGAGTDLSLFDFEFSVDKQMYQNTTTAKIKIWNLGDDTIDHLMSKQYTTIDLWAGYQPPSTQYGRLFNGQIGYFKEGRQNTVDTFVELFAFSYDEAINASVVNTWLKQGWTTKDALNACVAVMGKDGIVLGQVPDMNSRPQPRGRLLFGNPRDIVRDIARTENAQAFYDNGKLHLLRPGEVLKLGSDTVPILNVNTGMIDVPTRTMDGAVEVTCLLNPAIAPGGQIHVNNEDTTSFHPVVDASFVDASKQMQDSDFIFKVKGYYRVGSVKHEGQNRGVPWFSHIVTEQRLQPAPLPPTTLGT